MAQHLINLSFGFDDEEFIRAIKATAEQKILEQLKRDVSKELGLSGYKLEAMKDKVVAQIADEIVTDEFIEKISKAVANKVVSRKAFIEAVSSGFLKEMLTKEGEDAQAV